jgi:hypothetical protein
MARPEGLERAVQTLQIEGVRELVEALQAPETRNSRPGSPVPLATLPGLRSASSRREQGDITFADGVARV